MKYADILSLREGYHPVYDLENERPNQWKRFIPNENFNKVLLTTLNSLDPTSGQQKKKSIWLRGTYGTGKSHAASVIKHLLSEDTTNIDEYIEELDARYQSRIRAFREEKKVFPIVLKGASNIVDNESFSAVVQKAVSKALEENNISIATKNEFETAINFIRENKAHIDWETRIKEDEELRIYVNNKQDLITKLEAGSVEILHVLNNSARKAGYTRHVQDISKWLKEVISELRERDVADYLMIFWDEFTSVLDLEQKGVSSTAWQNIAELSHNDYVYLFLITHRFPTHYTEEDRDKVLGRFNREEYSMEPPTTYHIMEKAIKKTDKETWEEMKHEYLESNEKLMSLTKILTDNEGPNIKNAVINLFPIHPYTSYLITFISRYLGSTQRSVFEFLYDEEYGFIHFINCQPSNNKKIFLIPDKLWNFFLPEFKENRKGMVGPIIERYKSNIEKIKEEGKEYTVVFKAILLLNVLKHEIDVEEASASKVQPSEENIKRMFFGTEYTNKIDNVLSYLNKKNIIQKNPFGVFEITASTLDSKKVDAEMDQLRKNYGILDTLKREQKKELELVFTDRTLRICDVSLFNAEIATPQLKSNLHRNYKEPKKSCINIALFVGKDHATIMRVKEHLKQLLNDEGFDNILFVIAEEALDEKEFEKYLQYKARANVAEKLDCLDEKSANEELAEAVINNWIRNIKNQYATYFFRNDSEKIIASELSDSINESISPKIFTYGLENTPATKQPDTIWGDVKSKASVEFTLNPRSRNDLSGKNAPYRYLTSILKDSSEEWVIDYEMKIKKDADMTHPIVRASNEVERLIDDAPPHRFHLGEILSPLSEPPFGYYGNYVNLAAMGFLMRNYVNILYEVGSGNPIDKPLMKEKIIEIIEYWETGKERGNSLEVRLGTEAELQLIKKLKEIFNIDAESRGLNDIKWKIREYVREISYPIWVYKEFVDDEQIKNCINKIHNFIKSSDHEINEEKISNLLECIESYYLELITQLGEKNKGKEGFLKWIEKKELVDEVDLENDEIFDSIKNFIEGLLQEEVPFWEETKVENAILRWWKSQKEGGSNGEDTTIGPNDVVIKPPITGADTMPDDQVESIQKTLDDFQDTGGELSQVIVKFVKDHPEVWTILKQYLEDYS
ncbi:MAG: hypothetical protein R6U52_04390 [Kosmotogaceae bacterium]